MKHWKFRCFFFVFLCQEIQTAVLTMMNLKNLLNFHCPVYATFDAFVHSTLLDRILDVPEVRCYNVYVLFLMSSVTCSQEWSVWKCLLCCNVEGMHCATLLSVKLNKLKNKVLLEHHYINCWVLPVEQSNIAYCFH